MKQILSWRARAALLGASLGVAAILAEVLLRVTGLAPANTGVFTVTEAQFGEIPGIWAPDQAQLVLKNPALPFRVRTNGLGYRGPDFERKKPDGQFRVLYLGDSFVFGDFVDDEETVPAQLERNLRQRCRDPLVINSGLGGSTITEHTPLLERGLSLSPDLVVLQFFENDVPDLAGPVNWDQLRQNRAAKSNFPMNIVYSVVRSTALWGLVLKAQRIRQDRQTAEADAPEPDAQGVAAARSRADSVVTANRARYAQGLADFDATVERNGLPMLFVAFPSFHSVYSAQEREEIEWVIGIADSLGIPRVDITPALAETGEDRETLYLMPHDGHASPRGNEIAARVIADQLFTAPGVLSACN